LIQPNGGYALDAAEFKLKLQKDLGQMIKTQATSSEIVLGVRPEDVTVHQASMPEAVETEVYVVEPLGSENVIDLKIGSYLVKALAPSTLSPDIGQKTYITFNKDKAHVFDKKTGKTIM
jgi:multiple sugar transport system ATP-binding protein